MLPSKDVHSVLWIEGDYLDSEGERQAEKGLKMLYGEDVDIQRSSEIDMSYEKFQKMVESHDAVVGSFPQEHAYAGFGMDGSENILGDKQVMSSQIWSPVDPESGLSDKFAGWGRIEPDEDGVHLHEQTVLESSTIQIFEELEAAGCQPEFREVRVLGADDYKQERFEAMFSDFPAPSKDVQELIDSSPFPYESQEKPEQPEVVVPAGIYYDDDSPFSSERSFYECSAETKPVLERVASATPMGIDVQQPLDANSFAKVDALGDKDSAGYAYDDSIGAYAGVSKYGLSYYSMEPGYHGMDSDSWKEFVGERFGMDDAMAEVSRNYVLDYGSVPGTENLRELATALEPVRGMSVDEVSQVRIEAEAADGPKRDSYHLPDGDVAVFMFKEAGHGDTLYTSLGDGYYRSDNKDDYGTTRMIEKYTVKDGQGTVLGEYEPEMAKKENWTFGGDVLRTPPGGSLDINYGNVDVFKKDRSLDPDLNKFSYGGPGDGDYDFDF